MQRYRENNILLNTSMIIGIFCLTIFIYFFNTRNIELKIADYGWGPQDYVNQKLHPESFKKNWPSGIMTYDNSLPIRVYYYLAKYCGISPTTTIYPYMFIQTLLFLLSVAFLTQTLFQNKLVTFISLVLISLSNLAGSNLSRFGEGYGSLLSLPQFYAYSNAFRFFAIGFFLRNKHIQCFVLLALSIYCHVNEGLFALAFIGAYVFYRPRFSFKRSFIAGILIFLLLLAPQILSIICNASISSGNIPVDCWVKSTRFFSSHWYPLTNKLFSTAHTEFFPFLSLCFFFFMALRYQDIRDEKNAKIIVGSIACLIMSLFGIIFSDIHPIPFVVKISFQRSTGLISFFGVLYLIYYLYRRAETGNVFNVFLAIYSLFVFIFAEPGIAILPLFLLLYSDIKEGHLGLIKISSNQNKTVKYFYYVTAIFLLFLTLICIVKYDLKTSSLSPIAEGIFVQLWPPLQYFSPLYGFDFLLRGGSFKVYPVFTYLLVCSALFAFTAVGLRAAKNRALTILFMNIFFVISLSLVWYLMRDQYLRWHNQYYEINTSYLNVQLWAKNNTRKGALFMPDPSHHYGWRDFSERSSFGNFREWGYAAIAYNPDMKVYQEGLRRMREFGVDIEKITDEDLRDAKHLIYSQKLNDIRYSYYNMSPNRLQRLCEKYGIDYFVMYKGFLSASQEKVLTERFKIAYMNDQFVVYSSETYGIPEVSRHQVELVMAYALLDFRSSSIVNEGEEIYIVAGTGQKMNVQGAVRGWTWGRHIGICNRESDPAEWAAFCTQSE